MIIPGKFSLIAMGRASTIMNNMTILFVSKKGFLITNTRHVNNAKAIPVMIIDVIMIIANIPYAQ
jgi:hypothetical protein